jgi:hypothetical protein
LLRKGTERLGLLRIRARIEVVPKTTGQRQRKGH